MLRVLLLLLITHYVPNIKFTSLRPYQVVVGDLVEYIGDNMALGTQVTLVESVEMLRRIDFGDAKTKYCLITRIIQWHKRYDNRL